VSGLDDFWVYIQLSGREEDETDWSANRIALKCETIGITSAKQVLSFPVPASGIITGESTALGLDLGMCTKTINLSGIITKQTLKKKFSQGSLDDTKTNYIVSNVATVTMTAHEVAQLMHSFVDSSALQTHQNLNELIILYPSFIGRDYLYHQNSDWAGYDAGDSSTHVGASDQNLIQAEVDALNPDKAPLLPFTYAVRYLGQNSKKLDDYRSFKISDFPIPATTTTDVNGMKGFIRSFNTTFTGGNPFVDFTMDFEVAITGFS
jgi:hypothetical protein